MLVRFGGRARSDTFSMWDDLASAGDRFGSAPVDPIDNAEAFARRLSDACARIVGDPQCGAARDDVAPGLRALSCEGVVVFYVAGAETIDVVRVLPRVGSPRA